MRKFFEILKKYPAVNFGDVKTGSRFNSDWQTIRDGYKDQSVAHYVFSDAEAVAKILKELKEADLGLSVIVSGVFEKVGELCRQAGLPMHTVEYSGGVMGRTERLPQGAGPIDHHHVRPRAGVRQPREKDGDPGQEGQEKPLGSRRRIGQTLHVRRLQRREGRAAAHGAELNDSAAPTGAAAINPFD